MARKPNHAWERRQRELNKQAKRAAKLQRRQAAKDDKDREDGVADDGSTPDGAEGDAGAADSDPGEMA